MSSYGRQLFLDSEMTRIEKGGAVDYSDRIRLNESLPSKISAPERYSVTGLLLFSDEACNLSNWSRVLGLTLRQLLQSKAFNCA